MEWFTIILAVVIVLYFVLPRIRQISAEKAAALIKEGARFIDVRSAGEFATEAVPGSENVPVHTIISAAKAGNLKPDESVVLFCQSGMRSSRAHRQLKSLGFTDVEDLGTFSKAWQAHTLIKANKTKSGD